MSDIAVDTSMAVPLVLTSHRDHLPVNQFVGARSVRLAAHAHLETYSVLTRLPGDARLTGADADTLISDRFGDPIAMVEELTRSLLGLLARAGVVGGSVYDGLIGLTAHRAGLRLATRDRRAAPTLLALGIDYELMSV